MTLIELAKKFANKKYYYNPILATDGVNYLYYVNEIIYDDDYKKIYLIMNLELDKDCITPNKIVRESKKSYKNYYQVELLCIENNLYTDIKSVGNSQYYNPSGNQILYF